MQRQTMPQHVCGIVLSIEQLFQIQLGDELHTGRLFCLPKVAPRAKSRVAFTGIVVGARNLRRAELGQTPKTATCSYKRD